MLSELNWGERSDSNEILLLWLKSSKRFFAFYAETEPQKAAQSRSRRLLVPAGNSSGGLKTGGELPCALCDSAAVAQNIAQAAGQLLARAPQPRFERVA